VLGDCAELCLDRGPPAMERIRSSPQKSGKKDRRIRRKYANKPPSDLSRSALEHFGKWGYSSGCVREARSADHGYGGMGDPHPASNCDLIFFPVARFVTIISVHTNYLESSRHVSLNV